MQIFIQVEKMDMKAGGKKQRISTNSKIKAINPYPVLTLKPISFQPGHI
jgi:hypothetical protein